MFNIFVKQFPVKTLIGKAEVVSQQKRLRSVAAESFRVKCSLGEGTVTLIKFTFAVGVCSRLTARRNLSTRARNARAFALQEGRNVTSTSSCDRTSQIFHLTVLTALVCYYFNRVLFLNFYTSCAFG